MSKLALSGDPSGTGTFTIAAPNSNTDRTISLPDAAGDMVLTTATQSFTNKSFDSAPVPTVSGTAPLYMCRAWVNFNGTTATPSTIRGSGNVSSITKLSTGRYLVNMTTAMPDVNYAVLLTTDLASDGPVIAANTEDYISARTTSVVRIVCAIPGVGVKDTAIFQVAIFR